MTTESIKDKITKMLRLARDTGATEEEAANALRMAARLMTQHGIEESQLETRADKAAARLGAKLDEELDVYEADVMAAAGVLYGCETLYYPHDRRRCFVGRPDNIEIAELTRVWLTEQVEALYKMALPRGLTKSLRAKFRKNFKQGCARRVYQRAQEHVREMTEGGLGNGGGTALTVAGYFKQLNTEVRQVLTSIGSRPGRARSVSTGFGTDAGRAYGDRVQLRREVQ